MSGSAEETRKHVETYKKVGGSLAVLTVVTVLASYIDIGVALGITLALIIATTKGSLVVSFFMHLIDERIPWLLFTLGLTVVFWIVFLVFLWFSNGFWSWLSAWLFQSIENSKKEIPKPLENQRKKC